MALKLVCILLLTFTHDEAYILRKHFVPVFAYFLMPILMYAPAYSTLLIHYRSFTKSKDKVYVNITSALFINTTFILD